MHDSENSVPAAIRPKTRNRPRFAANLVAVMTLMIGSAVCGSGQTGLNQSSATEEEVESAYDQSIREAAERVVASEWLLAFRKLNETLELDPDRPEAYFTYGRAHQLRGEFASAERAFRKLLEIDPDLSAPWFELAKILVLKGELNEALECTRQAIRLSDPKDWRHYTFLGELYAEMELRASAEQAFDDAAKLLRERIEPLQRAITEITSEVDILQISEVSEYVAPMNTGVIEEIPSVRYQYQSRSAPVAMTEHLDRLKGELATVESRKTEVLVWMESD